MCFCIKCYSSIKKGIRIDYLGICEVVETTADALTDVITPFIKSVHITLEKQVASNLCANNKSEFTLF